MVNPFVMPGPSVQRTIVKSQPEIWSEVSDATSLSRHLGAFGEITISELTPETAVAWEGDRVRGTVTLERSGWGTKVTVTAETEEGAATPDAEPFAAPEVAAEVTEVAADTLSVAPPVVEEAMTDATVVADAPDPAPAPDPPLGFWARLARRWRTRAELPVEVVTPELVLDDEPEAVPVEPEPIVVVDVEPDVIAAIEPDRPAQEDRDLDQVLTAMLDHLSAAHHRPFSRG